MGAATHTHTHTAAPSVLLKAKDAYALWFKLVADFPKTYRYSLGGKIDDYFLELLECVFTSLYLPIERKISRIEASIGKLDGVKFFLQLAWENKCVPNEKYMILSTQLDEIGRMLGNHLQCLLPVECLMNLIVPGVKDRSRCALELIVIINDEDLSQAIRVQQVFQVIFPQRVVQ